MVKMRNFSEQCKHKFNQKFSMLTDVFVCVFLNSHDFIGEFSTSYRELSRGQSQFNVYEVSCQEHSLKCFLTKDATFLKMWQLLFYCVTDWKTNWNVYKNHFIFQYLGWHSVVALVQTALNIIYETNVPIQNDI